MGLSPFSSEFSALSQPQVMWAITNYYKDQHDDLEKYKLICRFVNPEAAASIWDTESQVDPSISFMEEDAFLTEIKKHTKESLSDASLFDRINNPEKYDVDIIERVS